MIRALVVAPIVAATLAAACGKGSKDTPAIGKHDKLEYPVDVAPLEQRQMSFAVGASGQTDAYSVQITARVAGPVDDVKFVEGAEVAKDQALVTIDRARYAIALSQSKAAYAKAVATEKSAEAALNRRLDAQKESPGLVPGEEIEQKQTAVDTAKADVEAAKQDQLVAELNLKESTVFAPTKGVVQTRTVQQGQYLSPGNVLATLVQHDPMLIRFMVEGPDAPRLRHAMEHGPLMASFVVTGELPYAYSAKLTFLAESADPSTRMFQAVGEVVPPDKDKPDDKDAKKATKRLRSNQGIQVSIPVGTPRPGIVVPQIAVQPTEKGKVVYIIDSNNVAHQKIVQTGMHTSDGGIELTRGVNPGDLLVVSGSDPLSEGANVTIKNRLTLEAASQAMNDAGIDQPSTTASAESGSATTAAAATPTGGAVRQGSDRSASGVGSAR